MYALNLASDGRVLSASPASMAPVGSVFASYLPEGNLYEYRYVNGEYIHDPLPAAVPTEESSEATTADMAAAILEGVNDV